MRSLWLWLAGCGVADVDFVRTAQKDEESSLVVDGGASATTDKKVSVQVRAPGSPKRLCISETSTCTDDRKFKEHSTYKFDSEGWKTLYALVSYTDGTTLQLGPSTILYDKTRPTDPAVSASSYGHTVTLAWSGATDNTGVVEYRVSGPWSKKEDKKCENGQRVEGQRVDFADLPEGQWHFRVCSVDGAGNVSKGDTIKVPVTHERLVAGPAHLDDLPVQTVVLNNPGPDDTFTVELAGPDGDSFELVPGPYGIRDGSGLVATIPRSGQFTFYVARRQGAANELHAQLLVDSAYESAEVPLWAGPTESLGLWFRADAVAAAEGDLVTTWEDQSGEYHDLWTAPDHDAPEFRYRYGIPGLEFPGAYSAMYQEDPMDFSESTVLIAWKSMTNSDAASPGLLNFGTEYDYDSPDGMSLTLGGIWSTFSLYRNHDLYATAPVEYGERAVLSARSGAGSGVVGVNGWDGISDEYTTQEEVSSSGFVLNGRWLFGAPHWNGGNPTYHEVMFLKKKLSDSDVRNLECYLAARWQIAEHEGDCWQLRTNPVENPITDLPLLEAYYAADHVGDGLVFSEGSRSGGEVAIWSDVSGNERHVFGDDALPTYQTFGANGLPSLVFEDDVLAADPGPFVTGAQPRTIVAVVRSLGTTSLGLGHIVHWGSTACQRAYGLATTADGTAFAGHYWCPVSVAGSFEEERYQVVVAEYDGAVDRMYRNGELMLEYPIELDTGDAHGVHIGARIHPYQFGRFEIAELAIYSEALSDWDRAGVEAFLAEKYLIDL